ncbi:hypothetical protein GFS24_04345 [Chitinophaga sp. SYP-B3965]|uniref:pentapeptide repeat-containing protein n=1 Tax=Chitinophaga sp. SYP-B3965 TaxID=2663120 RepID=UPI00129A07F6|nr:pentapeptide repeat-containing protein [Chitinophaga sp. SYP-B3965]MRG44328.1 hypothetical protein [Chitinophaga sp. SYP-B3965]
MKKIDLTKRWEIEPGAKSAGEKIMRLFRKGGKLLPEISPFELIEGKTDLRGINTGGKEIKKCVFENADLSFSTFSDSWIEKTKFNNCHFFKVDFSDFSDHGNLFEGCVFYDCKFNYATIGAKGSVFGNCIFEKCNFSKAIFIRAEYTRSEFKNCKMRDLDFNASSFEDCVFEGELSDIWFRGTFPLKSNCEYFGWPKMNEMKNVSFEKAELIYTTFSNNCDLSSVIINNNGKYHKYNNWKKRLEYMVLDIGELDAKERAGIENFSIVYSLHAETQDWYIINIEDLEGEYGISIALRIINLLNEFSNREK